MSSRLARAVIVVVALAHAAIFIVYQRPDWETQWTDQNGYLMLGRTLAETGRFTRYASSQVYVPEAIRTPMYPAFVALLDVVFGESRLAITAAHALMFAIVCLLVYEIARETASERVALVAGLATALYPPLPYFGALVLTEMLTTLLMTAGLAVWLGALRRDSPAPFVVSGLLFAATALTRPAFEYLPLFLIAAAVITAGADRRRAVRGSAIMLVVFAAAIAPWMVYNVVYFHTFTFTPAGGPGRQLFEGSWQAVFPGRVQSALTTLADEYSDRQRLDDEVRKLAEQTRIPVEPMLRYVHQHKDIRRIWIEPVEPWARTTARIEADHEYFRVGAQNIRRDPLGHAWRRATYGTFLLWAAEIPVRYSAINQLSPWTIRAMWLVQAMLLLLAAAGAVMLARRGALVEAGSLAAVIIYVSAVHVPLYSEARYSLPAKPVVLLLAVMLVEGGLNGRRAGYRPLSHT
jgi:hypothetical protein